MLPPGQLLCGLVVAGYVAAQSQEPFTDFSTLLKQIEFVDKTLLIKTVFETPAKKIMLTAPSRSGKSTLVDMMERFLEIEVDEDGRPLTRTKTRKEFVRDTPNYRLFTGNHLKIAEEEEVMDHYLGKYPVIHADFKCKYTIDNSENAVICFREVVHEAYKRHRYLRKSEVLNSKEKRLVKKWSDSYGAYEELYGQDVTNSLYKLAIVLHKHFGGRKVFVLVDNYEYPTTRAMFQLKNEKELERVIKFNMAIISKLLSADFRYVDRAVVLGLSYVAAAGPLPLADVRLYRFLGYHSFAEYFGLTTSEVKHLFAKPEFKLGPKQISAAHSRYRGYESRSGRRLYGLYSVRRFLQTGEVRSYIVISGLLKKIGRLFKIPFIREKIEAMILDGGVASICLNDIISIQEIFNLVNVIKLKLPEHINLNLIFYFLLEQGYFSYAPQQAYTPEASNTTEIKIPNDEIKSIFAFKLKDYYDGIYKIDKTLLRKSASFFDSISPSLTASKIHFKRALYWFYNSVEQLIRNSRRSFARVNGDVHTLMFSVVYQVNVKVDGKYKIIVQNNDNGKFSALIESDKFRFVIGTRTDCDSSGVLRSIMGRVATGEGFRRCVLIGVGVSADWQTSLSCLLLGRNVSDALHLP